MNAEVYNKIKPHFETLKIIIIDQSVGAGHRHIAEALKHLHNEAGLGKVIDGCVKCFFKAMGRLYNDYQNFEAMIRMEEPPKKKKSSK